MKKVILIDDEPLARGLLIEYLAEYPDLTMVAECGNGFEGIKAIASLQPDLVFLDVQMPKITGFEMLELLPACPPVIFTTAYDEYALKAFEANAIDYLLKPFNPERLRLALEKWRQQMPDQMTGPIQKMLHQSTHQPEEQNRIVIKDGSEIRIIPVAEILYLEAYDDYVKIYKPEGYFLKKKTMNYYESVLDPQTFFRTHRSYMINIQHLTKIETLEKNSYVAILRNGSRIPVSRTSYARLKEVLGI